MLTHDQIREAVAEVAKLYPIKTVHYFGSYADGNATEKSDLDLLVEFSKVPISLLVLSGLKIDFEDRLNTSVDVVPIPLSEDSFIEIGKVVTVYGQT
jgi:predicted nucleotidyltransferase